ncbi:MAG TPA: Flp family type IVb pilin [Terriglobales bacterium]|jgi:Flp pilus assembly pilin Flp|nr:Flp family type IVb pilin [Terriglobales bacterium]
MSSILLNLHKEESGQDLIEYVMLAALLVIAAIVLLGTVAQHINSEFSRVIAALT